MLTFLTIAGGVALLLFGVRYLRKGLDRLFGPRLGFWVARLTSTRLSAFLSGLGIAITAPSSTTVSLLAVQTVQAGQLSTLMALAIMLGANIGLTVLVQLLALDVEQVAPLCLLVGVGLFQFTERSRSRGIGQVLISVGFILLAMELIRRSVEKASLGENEDFRQLVRIASRYPFVLAILAAALTVVLQSSTATLGLLIGLMAADVVGLAGALPVVVGANVGMAITTMIVGWRHVDSRRLAVANLLLKLALGVVVLLLLGWVLLKGTLASPDPALMPVVTAQLHTGFNVLLAMAGLPLVRFVDQLVHRMIPAPLTPQGFGPKFIRNGPVDGMALALGQSLRELMHMAEIIRGMLEDVWVAMNTNDESMVREVSARDDKVDHLDEAIKGFLTRLVREESDHLDADEQMRQLRYLSELETIGDIVDKNLCELVQKKIRLRAVFSHEGQRELEDFYRKVMENLDIAVTAFTTRDQTLARQLLRHKERINAYEQELRDRHFARLNAARYESLETSSIHLDLLTHLRRINSGLTHVAYAILKQSREAEQRPERMVNRAGAE